jgi:hypothetical protein
MKVTDKMVMADAREMESAEWLAENWDKPREGGPCECCGQHKFSNYKEDILNTKNTIRHFLEAALKAAK